MTSIITPNRKDYIPEGATCLTREGVKAEVWNFTNSEGKPAAMGFKGRAQKPAFYYWFSDAKKRTCRVNAFFDAVAQAGKDAAARRRGGLNASSHTILQSVLFCQHPGAMSKPM